MQHLGVYAAQPGTLGHFQRNHTFGQRVHDPCCHSNLMEPIGGDFFRGVPVDADAYILRMVIHDWAEPEIFTIVSHVREAMKLASRLVLIEMIVPETTRV